jgi:hypothetical protein
MAYTPRAGPCDGSLLDPDPRTLRRLRCTDGLDVLSVYVTCLQRVRDLNALCLRPLGPLGSRL